MKKENLVILDELDSKIKFQSKQANRIFVAIVVFAVVALGFAAYVDHQQLTPYSLLQRLVGQEHVYYTTLTSSMTGEPTQYTVNVAAEPDSNGFIRQNAKRFSSVDSSLDGAVQQTVRSMLTAKDSTCTVTFKEPVKSAAVCGTFVGGGAVDLDDLSVDSVRNYESVKVSDGVSLTGWSINGSNGGMIYQTESKVEPKSAVEPKKSETVKTVKPAAPVTPPTYQTELLDYDTRFTNLKSILGPLEQDFKDKKLDAGVLAMYSTAATQYNVAREWLTTFRQAVALGVGAGYSKGRLDTELSTAETVVGQLGKVRGVRY